jgi:hypothetical protein
MFYINSVFDLTNYIGVVMVGAPTSSAVDRGYSMARTSQIIQWDDYHDVRFAHNWIFIALAHWNNSPLINKLIHSDILSPLRSNTNYIGVVMVGAPTSSAVDRGFDPLLDKTNDYKIGMCCFMAMNTAIVFYVE